MDVYGDWHYMRTHQNLDYHSLLDEIDEIMGLDCGIGRTKSEYFGRYSDECNKVANMASYLYTDFRQLANRLGSDFPYRDPKFDVDSELDGSGILWFNTAIATLDNSNLITALEHEDESRYYRIDWREMYNMDYRLRKARLNMLQRLPKAHLLLLLVSVNALICKAAELKAARDTITGLVDELEARQNVNVKKDGTVVYHPGTFM